MTETQQELKSKSVKIDFGNGQVVEYPIYEATIGQNVVDFRTFWQIRNVELRSCILSTAACESKITYIDGDKGQLFYRGYPIEQLAEHSTHLEGAYLLLSGSYQIKHKN